MFVGVGVAAFSTGVVLVVLGGVCIVSDVLRTEPCDSASISVDVISSIPRNVVADDDDETGGGGVRRSVELPVEGVAGRAGLAVRSEFCCCCCGGGGLGAGRKFDCTIC